MSEPDQAYEDAKGEAIVEEHEQHPERFHAVPPMPPQLSPVAWDRQPDYAPPDYSGPPPCPKCGRPFHTDPRNHPAPCPPARCGPLPPPPHGYTGWRHMEPCPPPGWQPCLAVAKEGPTWFWSSLRECWEWTPYTRPSHHQIVAVNDQTESRP